MKNKEIEELLNELKEDVKYYKNDYDYKNSVAFFNVGKIELLLSYIEQLETEIKEANDSITWWQNRYNAVERDKKQLENNRDKALEYIEKHNFMSDWGSCIYGEANLYDIIKGGSDD